MIGNVENKWQKDATKKMYMLFIFVRVRCYRHKWKKVPIRHIHAGHLLALGESKALRILFDRREFGSA